MMHKSASSVDILLLLEGTFPYVRGGVSSWVNRMIQGFPGHRFGVIFLGSARNEYMAKPYALPENVDYYAEYFLHDSAELPHKRFGATDLATSLEPVEVAHAQMRKCIAGKQEDLDLGAYANNFSVNQQNFLYSEKIWEYFLARYAEIPDQPPFVDYFWTIRGMHAPLWVIQNALEKAPQAKIMHCPSTGYAGYLGALLSHQQDRPLILSEHGIYTKERRIDLMLARWIQEDEEFLQRAGHIHYLRQLWINFFALLGRISYRQADSIINLYAGVIPLQVADGASPEKLQTIPNGIAVENFISCRKAYAQRQDVVALIGRVVPIKDIKTFIRAAAVARDQGRSTRFWIVGPTEEDEEYFTECTILLRHLQLQEQVKFLGFRAVTEVLQEVRLTVLSSISEGLPLSVLESFAAGVPVVSTDVGSCRELILGADGAHPAPAGKVVPIAEAQALAKAIYELLDDTAEWQRCSDQAILRVESQYREEQMFSAYRHLYDQALRGS
ncbi:GT4 family glycosyltransferase PelF [Acidithiobacillus sp. IBUN Pt1247-S3]|uniref:GT4 family glycosyltransferase PelF n=1 Tax=Acidithiobacillus sp. IBUN Pt1247-S3 TaxID=3166642 RepID=UPI0034E50FE1